MLPGSAYPSAGNICLFIELVLVSVFSPIPPPAWLSALGAFAFLIPTSDKQGGQPNEMEGLQAIYLQDRLIAELAAEDA